MPPFYKSRTFLLGLLDIVISFILLLVGVQFPQSVDIIKTVIFALQPLVVMLIIAVTVEGSILANFAIKAVDIFTTSRKFWLGTLDLVVSLILLIVGIQIPQYLVIVQTIIWAIQPLIVSLIVAWTIDDTFRAVAYLRAR